MSHSLLDEPLISVRFTDGEVRECSLPEVLAKLVRGDILSFEALQPHQRQPWHSFLVQLASIGMARLASNSVPENDKLWRNVLLDLSNDEEDAWRLVVNDVTRPAFMQSPVPEGSLEKAKYRADVPTPDQLDVLVTSKNHDVKPQRILYPRPEHWVYALVTLQTMEGFLGRGNYGIVRMNGGFGNRPMVGLTKSLTWGEHFQRDIRALVSARESLLRLYDSNGQALLWLEPWDGGRQDAIPLQSCDPYFIEICRRIRFTEKDGQLICWRTNTKSQRVSAPDTLAGVTQDPWTPIEKESEKALTVGEAGFTYKLVQQIFLSGKYTRPPAVTFQENEKEGAYLVAQTLVRGQGKTDGLHHRIIPVSRKAAGWLTEDPSNRELLGKRAEQRVEKSAEVQRTVLYPAIAALLASGRNEKVDSERVAPWLNAFDRTVDTRFFESLWASVELDQETAHEYWQRFLRNQAERQFDAADRSTPIAAIHRWKARSKARSIFESRARDVLPLAYEHAHQDRSDKEVSA